MKKWYLIFCMAFPGLVYSIQPEKAFVELAKKVSASVVNISVKKRGDDSIILFPGYVVPFESMGSGSGFIIDKEGLIVTNAHVVEGSDTIHVQFSGDKKFYKAKVLGLDSRSDIALLKVKVKKKLVPFKLGDSEDLQVGEWVAAIGNPHGYGHTMTKGIISAVGREIDDLNLFPLLQTDASINLGNSGGPLVNLKGEVIGVNQAIARGATGIGFAIPISNVKEVLKDLKSFGFVKKAFIGVELFGNDGQLGVLISNVVPGSPAEKSGLQIGDRIMEFSGKKIKRSTDLPDQVRKTPAGKQVSLSIVRNGKTLKLKITPQMLEKDSFSYLKSIPPNRRGAGFKGTPLSGGFQLAPSSRENLRLFGQPYWQELKNPIVMSVKAKSPAEKGGLKAGDLIFEINNKSVSNLSQAKKALKKTKNQLKVFRYHQRYGQYHVVLVQIDLGQ